MDKETLDRLTIKRVVADVEGIENRMITVYFKDGSVKRYPVGTIRIA